MSEINLRQILTFFHMSFDLTYLKLSAIAETVLTEFFSIDDILVLGFSF